MLHPSIVEQINLLYKSQLWTTHYEHQDLLRFVRNFSVLFAIRELGRETKKYSWQSFTVAMTNWCIYGLISVCWCSRWTYGRPFLHCLCSRWSMPTRKTSGGWSSWSQLSGCRVRNSRVALSRSFCSVQETFFKLPSESVRSQLCSAFFETKTWRCAVPAHTITKSTLHLCKHWRVFLIWLCAFYILVMVLHLWWHLFIPLIYIIKFFELL